MRAAWAKQTGRKNYEPSVTVLAFPPRRLPFCFSRTGALSALLVGTKQRKVGAGWMTQAVPDEFETTTYVP